MFRTNNHGLPQFGNVPYSFMGRGCVYFLIIVVIGTYE